MSLTKIGSIGINTGIAFAGVTTIVTLNTANDALSIGATVNVGSGITLGASGDIFATGVSTFSGNLKVGSGVTISPDGDGFYTGVVTATSFKGAATNLTSIPAANLTGTLPAISGANLTNLDASDLASGTVPTARLGSGTASSSTFLRGDSTFAAVTSTTINNNGNDRIITGSGTANTLEGESNLQFDGTDLYVSDNIKHLGDPDTLIEFSTDQIAFDTGGGERLRIDAGGLRVNKTTTSDYGRFEVKGPTADDIDTSTDIRTKTVATFSGSTPGTTAAGKGMGIVIKPIADRGSHYFFGAANDSANQESHGRFIIRSGHLASSSTERLRINSSGQVELSQNLLPLVDNTPSIGNGTKNFNSIWASTRFRGNDNVKLVLGDAQDLVIYHASAVNYINSPQGGSLHIKSGTGDNANLKHIQCDYNGNTIIYHQNGGSEAARITTTNDGITFGGEVNFNSGYNVRTFAGTVALADGAHADIVQNNSGYGWGYFEFYCVSYHGSIGRARWHGEMSRYSNNGNFPTISNSMAYCDLQRIATGSPSGQVNMIRIQRTGTYGNVTFSYYVRCYSPNSTANWSGAGYATQKYSGN